MAADVPTLLLMIVVSSVVVAGAMLVLGWGRSQDGLPYWAGALLLSAVGYVLYLLRGRVADGWSIVLANVLLSAALSGLLAALHRFQGRRLRWWALLAPPMLMAPLMFAFLGDFAARVALSAFVMAGQTLWLLWALHRPGMAGRGAWLLAAGLALEAAVLLLRGVSALLPSLDIATLLQGNTVQTLTFMVAFTALLVTSFGFVFMGKDRADEHNRLLAEQDALTGVANRRSIIAALERDVARAIRTREPLALMMIDIDHFKRVNDRHGHLAGDQVLRAVVERVGQRLRAQDILGRYGGEEFLVVLPDTTLQGAQQLAQQLCEAVQAQPVDCGGQRIAVALSIGVFGGRLEPSDSWDLLIHAADNALYRAKEAGRNRVEVADGAERVRPAGAAAQAGAGPTTFPSTLH